MAPTCENKSQVAAAGAAAMAMKRFRSPVLSPKAKASLLDFTLWLFNIAMEHGPSIDDFPIKTTILFGDSPWLC